MELINVSRLAAGYSMATDPSGRQWIVLVAKATFDVPIEPGMAPSLLDEQVPLCMGDEYTGEPASSPLHYENDFALRKPRCDILLNGSCYAPKGRLATRLPVGIRVGKVAKAFAVVGHRRWKGGVLGFRPSYIEPFSVMPISYANAYGGIDRPDPDESTHSWYASNPVGVGFRPRTPKEQLVDEPLPNTEELDRPIDRRDGDYVPMALGPLGRSWKQRLHWAGTYDAAWKRTQYPFLPLDFNERYFQSAPDDQQCEYLTGDETVKLLNLTPEGSCEFRIPRLSEPFDVHYRNGQDKRLHGVIDTLLLEPDLRRFTMTLRASFEIRRSVQEVRSIEFGRVIPQAVPADDAAPVYAAKRRATPTELVAERQGRQRAPAGGT